MAGWGCLGLLIEPLAQLGDLGAQGVLVLPQERPSGLGVGGLLPGLGQLLAGLVQVGQLGQYRLAGLDGDQQVAVGQGRGWQRAGAGSATVAGALLPRCQGHQPPTLGRGT